jgi:hypothetical protein
MTGRLKRRLERRPSRAAMKTAPKIFAKVSMGGLYHND